MGDGVRAVILGIIEGLTEFLPVSSTGHMILAMPALGVDGERDPWPAFLYLVQVGAILAVVVHFFRPLARQIMSRPPTGLRDHLLVKLAAGTLPAAIIGIPLNDWAERHLEKPAPVAMALVVGAVAMIAIERWCGRRGIERVEDVTLRQAVLVGLAQCVSIIPGTSRAMATIMGGMVVGMSPAVAAEFSFYMAIPTICGAGLYRVVKHPDSLGGGHLSVMAIGFLASFLVAWAVVAVFIRYLKRRPLWPFAVYRIVIGAAVLAGSVYWRP